MEQEEEESNQSSQLKALVQDLINQTPFSNNPITRFRYIINRANNNWASTTTTADPSSSNSIIVIDIIWNLCFVFVSLFLLLSTLGEHPSTPLRIWICGYGVQCVLHVWFLYLEHHRRGGGGGGGDEENDLVYLAAAESRGGGTSVAKRLESMNSMVSFFWWLVGFYWIVMGGQALLQDAPRLYWLTVVFLAFDVFFAIFCVVLACMIGIAVFCCLPCIIVMLYSMVVREGASEDDIRVLPRYKFHQIVEPRLIGLDWKQEVAVMEMDSAGDSISEISLPVEDSECCICLSKYVDGVELHSLPCNHHFHCGCIVKWLRICAKCPLCKQDILIGEELV